MGQATSSMRQAENSKLLDFKTLKIPTIMCEGCQEKLTNALERVQGVAKVEVNLLRKEAKVFYPSDKPVSIEDLITAVENTGTHEVEKDKKSALKF